MVSPSDLSSPKKQIPFYKYFCSLSHKNYKFDAISSEEGGRFLGYQNRHIILECPENFAEKIPEDFKWISYYNLMELVSNTSTVNVHARTLLSSINFCDE